MLVETGHESRRIFDGRRVADWNSAQIEVYVQYGCWLSVLIPIALKHIEVKIYGRRPRFPL